ncbi:MAG: hypothetical protein ABJ081_04020 [Hyphomicrobiales bacterium]
MTLAHRLLFMLTAVAVALCVATVSYPVDWSQPIGEILGVLIFAVALMVPFIIIFAFTRFVKTTKMVFALCGLNVLLMGLWIYFFGSTFIWNQSPDAQDGLLFAVAPIYGIVLAVGFGGLIFLADVALRALQQQNAD